MRQIKTLYIIAVLSMLTSCAKYLDVVPDNVATIENAFTLRTSAEKSLFTCYSFMPDNGYFNTNTAFNAADEVWYMDPVIDVNQVNLNIAKGKQNINSPLGNFWSGTNQGKPLFEALRNCNTFLENIDKVMDLNQWERERWIAEVKFLKAYYHFLLFQRYGPIPVIRENLSISSSKEVMQVYREPVDSVINYMVRLLDESFANENLPDRISGTEGSELGRITKSIVIAFKAKVLVTAASPLFNGNPEYVNYTDNRGIQLFNSEYSADKWQKASDACKEAIDFCSSCGYSLSTFAGNVGYILNDTITRELDIRTAITNKINNPEVIWPNTNSRANDMQRWCMTRITKAPPLATAPKGIIAPTLKMAEIFYTKNGVPINEDKTWDYTNRYLIKKGTDAYKFYIKTGEETVNLHFDREPRFYADLGFDRGIWFGNWVNNYSVKVPLNYVESRKGGMAGRYTLSNCSITGYFVKKLVNIETSLPADGAWSSAINVQYPWPELRLADLYLLYSEALNELNGPGTETYKWINLVRTRAGLESVEDSWTNYAKDPIKYTTREGLRDIIQQERTIELAFEGQRYWDIKRWKTAHIVLNNPIKGWDITQSTPQSFYNAVFLFNQTFTMRDYFWPIETKEMQTNSNLVQSPGW